MAVEPESLEWSLPVPSVQELAIQGLQTVPASYVRDDTDIIITTPSDPSLRIPLIDMTKLVNPDSQQQEIQRLHSACKEWGLFQIINHGVSDESLSNMKEHVRGFFDLPLQEKKHWAQKPGSLEGYGQAFVTSEEQKLEWNDMIFLRTRPLQNRNLNFWPEKPQGFRKALETYSEDLSRLAVSIIRFIAMGLGVEAQQYSETYREGLYDIRMNCYPPCPEPERVLGFNPHADISGITLLLECGDTAGLQVLKDGHWVVVEPIDGALVANLGHVTQIMSNGIYKAPDHRAMVNKSKQRLSIVTFCYPNSSANIGPAEKLIKSGSPPLFTTLKCEEYFHRFYNRKLEVSFIDSLKI
ncbi:oxoglutarate-dependent flavonoid 7-O-demethylase 1-like [Alnus glutinosa]|uniref:oxoglutarate-dependent flavonoid 7-O-demethylase 1-like n=1 Tax=Alnus glutinosa TaxID=3517 RepID=UPI002D79FC56|nr:oxoglutarate-dependent flavonoid 7-O-demethylase 1-like [Alnus glutinosa]XP_062174886.1 oxoglutarate-dependent flavonoid 7-O-demethylase 1-like [Alnus glutinosa]